MFTFWDLAYNIEVLKDISAYKELPCDIRPETTGAMKDLADTMKVDQEAVVFGAAFYTSVPADL
jgi:hypothetical protein